MSIIDDEIETQRKEAPPYRFIDPQTIFEDGYWMGPHEILRTRKS